MNRLTEHRIRTEDDIETFWRRLMDPLGFTGRAITLLPIIGTEALPSLVEVGDLPEHVDDGDEHTWADFLRMLRRELGTDRVSALLSRPGTGRPTAADMRWVRLLQTAALRAEVPTGLTYLATDAEIRPVRLDDV